MARRATHLRRLRNSPAPPVLVLGGPHELIRPGRGPSEDAKLQALAGTYATLDYDLGVFAPEEHEALIQAQAGPPPNWVTADAVRAVVLDVGGRDKMGVVVFPALPDETLEIDAGTRDKIDQAVARLKAEQGVRLVAGISPWGYGLERNYLAGSPAAPVDLLFGSGPGIGFPGRVVDKGRTFWTRPSYEGMAVTRVDILAWPDRNGDFAWQPSTNITARMEYLGDDVVPDAKLFERLLGFGND